MLPASLRKRKWWPRRSKSSVLRIPAHFSPIPWQGFPQMVCFLLWWKKKKTGNRWRTVDGTLTHVEHFTKSIHKTDLRTYNYKWALRDINLWEWYKVWIVSFLWEQLILPTNNTALSHEVAARSREFSLSKTDSWWLYIWFVVSLHLPTVVIM